MDIPPTAPFTPLFSDQPMEMVANFDLPIDDWPEADWAPGGKVSTQRPHCIGASGTFLGENGENWQSVPTESNWDACASEFVSLPQLNNTLTSATPFGFANTNQFINGDAAVTGSSDLIFDRGCQSIALENNNATVVSSSIRVSPMEMVAATSDNPNESFPSTSLDRSQQNEQENEEPCQSAPDTDFIIENLATLPHSVLKTISKTVADAMIIATQKVQQKARDPREETAFQLREKRGPQKAATASSTVEDILRCGYPGCNATFRHKKDRLRHVRQNHTGNTGAFSCPVIDCPMGFRHKFHRSDKLRDHLRGKKISSYQWTCVLPGCSEVAATRTGLLDHLGQHDYYERYSNSPVLENYGLASWSTGYLTALYICTIKGCPFGTDSQTAMSSHLSIPHDGPFCPCPIPNCEKIFQDYQSVGNHLARDHDIDTRERFKKEISEQCLLYWKRIFVCPICDKEVKIGGSGHKIRNHCQEHHHDQLFLASERLLDAWIFSIGPTLSIPLREFYGPVTLNADNLFAYIILPDEEIEKLGSFEELEQAGAKLRADIEKDRL